jgi:hypothetical protein
VIGERIRTADMQLHYGRGHDHNFMQLAERTADGLSIA